MRMVSYSETKLFPRLERHIPDNIHAKLSYIRNKDEKCNISEREDLKTFGRDQNYK